MNSLAFRRYAGVTGLLLLIVALVAVTGIPASAGAGENHPPSTASTAPGCPDGLLAVINASITFDAGTSTVWANFETTTGCERTVTFALYRKLCDSPEFCLPQQLHVYVTHVVQPSQSYSWPLTVPDDCGRWQADLAYGDVIQDLSQETYGSRLIKLLFLNMGICEVTTTTTAPTTTTTAPTTTSSSTTTSTSTTTTTAPTTTSSSTTTSTSTTTTTAPTTTSSSTTTSTSTTTTTLGSTTTGSLPNDTPEAEEAEVGETEVLGTEVAGADVQVAGIQATAAVQAQVGADTLPFTGASTSSMVGLGAALAAGGAILLAASRRVEEKTTKRSWN